MTGPPAKTDPEVNSVTYWDTRFATDWVSDGGREQSIFFATAAVHLMPSWLLNTIRLSQLTICDWGCALGDGTDTLRKLLGAKHVAGIDFSQVAIRDAREKYARIEFYSVDVLHSPWTGPQFDILFSSNTLEHFSNPWHVADKLASLSRRYMVFLVPYEEDPRHREHFYSFNYSRIRPSIGSQFFLANAIEFDASNAPQTKWAGKQILLVYTRKDELRRLDSDVLTKENVDTLTMLARSLAEIEAYKEELTQVRAQYDALAAQNRDITNWAKTIESERLTLKSDLKAKHDSLESAARDAQVALQSLQSKNTALQDALAFADAARTAAERTAERTAEVQMSEITSLRNSLEKSESARKSALLRLERNITAQQSQQQMLEQRLGVLEGTVTLERHRAEQLHANHQIEGKKLSQELEAAKAQLTLANELAAQVGAELQIAKRTLQEITSSTVWRLTTKFRSLRKETTGMTTAEQSTTRNVWRLRDEIQRRGVRSSVRQIYGLLRLVGFRETMRRIAALTKVQPGVPATPFVTADQLYRNAYSSQRTYVNAYKDKPLQWRLQRVAHALRNAAVERKGVVLAPVAYDLTLKQRPEHVLKVLADEGYLCIMLEMNDRPRSIRQQPNGVYVSNLYEDVLAYFAGTSPILYIHYPPLSYVRDLFDTPFVVYDVLDDLSIFANAGEAMAKDHAALLASSDLTLFSSNNLFNRNVKNVANPLLLENGVWSEDFLPRGSTSRRRFANTRVGYHGAISELLDWGLLERISELPNIELVLVGPVSSFSPGRQTQLEEAFQKLISKKSVRYLGKIRYEDVSRYLGEIDVGLVPFAPSSATDGVSPLKLFEFIAAGLPVLASSTKTLAEYADVIFVGDANQIVELLKTSGWKSFDRGKYEDVLSKHNWRALTGPLVKRLASRQRGHIVKIPAKAKTRSGRIDFLNVTFFDWDGEVLYKGGAERYITDLAHLSQQLGYQPRVIQNAKVPFERNFKGIPVVGICAASQYEFASLSEKLCAAASEADIVVASPIELACRVPHNRPAISINHGIHWDGIGNKLAHFPRDAGNLGLVLEALQRSRTTVCVDTNFINWLRTIDWDLARELKYVPNYVDAAKFKPVNKRFDGKIRVLYPRRLYEPRGLYVTIDAFDELLPRFSDLHLTFCGQADTRADESATKSFMQRHPGRVEWIERDMDDMPSVYRDSHVVLIPTLYSEGTSLSCIEAFATNNAVVATNVGGLPNLVFDRVNGLLISPTSDALSRAVSLLCQDRRLCRDLARHALELSKQLSAERWRLAWSEMIQNVAW